MRAFNSAFAAQAAKRGCAPINLVTFGFTPPVYVSDRDVTPSGGSAHLGLVSHWGAIDTSAAQAAGQGVLGNVEISDVTITVLNHRVSGSRFSDHFTDDDPPEGVDVTIYQYFDGLLWSQAEIIYKGRVTGAVEYDQRTCKIALRSVWDRYGQKRIGEDALISADDYSSADPDDIGRMENIVYGTCPTVPCRALLAGTIDTLVADLDSSATSFYVSKGARSNYASGSVTVQIDAEQISGTYNQATGQFSSCTRGANTTTAAPHTKGSKVAQVLTAYVYEVAGHPVKSIDAVYVTESPSGSDLVKVTAGYTAYTGQTGDELAGYEGKAVIKFTTLPTLSRQVQLAASVTTQPVYGVSTQAEYSCGGLKKTLVPNDYNEASCANPTYAYDGNDDSYADLYDATFAGSLTLLFPNDPLGASIRHTFYARCGRNPNGSVGVFSTEGDSLGVLGASAPTGWYRFSITSSVWNLGIRFVTDPTEQVMVYEVYKEIEYTGAVARTTDAATSRTTDAAVALTGNSTADTVIGHRVYADTKGYKDDGDGTYTGSANALVERPDHVIHHFLRVVLGWPSDNIDATSFTTAGTFYAANSYALAFLINQPVTAEEFLMRLCFQIRSRMFVTPAGTARLLVRETAGMAVACVGPAQTKVQSLTLSRTPADDLLNRINLRWAKDLALEGNGPDQYLATKLIEDATSQSRYGVREWSGRQDLFLLDAIRLPAMAAHVGAFYLAHYKTARPTARFGVFLDLARIEPGDIVHLSHTIDDPGELSGQVLKLSHVFGSARRRQIDFIEITAEQVTDPLTPELNWWKLDERGGTTFADAGASGSPGTWIGSPALNQAGMLDAAAGLNGIDQYGYLAADPQIFDTGAALSIALWFKLAAEPGADHQTLLRLKTDGAYGFALGLTDDAEDAGLFFGNPETVRVRAADIVCSDLVETWTHLALVYSGAGATAPTSYTLYVNGAGATLTPILIDVYGSFTGANYVSIPYSANLGANNFTVEAYVKTTADDAEICNNTAGQGGNDPGGWRFFIEDGRLKAVLRDSVNALMTESYLSVATVNDGKWHHVAFVRSSTTLIGFIDGAKQSDVVLGGNGTVLHNAAADIDLGRAGDTALVGRLFELRISTVARWTASFTPPTLHEPDANTLVIARFVDGGCALYDSAGYDYTEEPVNTSQEEGHVFFGELANTTQLGASATGSATYFEGALDDIRVYSKALSAASVTALYNLR